MTYLKVIVFILAIVTKGVTIFIGTRQIVGKINV